LWAGQPIRIHGRYAKGGVDTIVVRGQLRNRAYEQKVRVELPQNESAHEAMATVWARQKVHQLMNQMVRDGKTKDLIEQVTQLGLTYRLMTQWTSFVAVEEKVVNVDGKLETVVQEIEMPEGVSYDGVFGEPAPVRGSKGLMLRGIRGPALRYAPQYRSKGMPPQFAPPPPPPASMPSWGTTMGGAAPSPVVPQAPATGKYAAKQENSVTFEAGKASLTPQAMRILDGLAMQICQDIVHLTKIVVTGHTDSSQADDFKQTLSRARATAVADYLINRCVLLTYHQFVIKSEADRLPIADNSTAVGRAKNRRVVIEIK